MILMQTLNFLINQKKRDAEVLYDGKRFASAVYIYGYAIEIALKKRICLTLGFTQGFPETQSELDYYIKRVTSNQVRSAGIQFAFKRVGEIRSHNLSQLLYYSGKELAVNQQFLAEWNAVSKWNPEQRYLRRQTREKTAADFFKAARLIINELS